MLLWTIVLGTSASAVAQTITLQPSAAAGKDAVLDSRLGTTNFGSSSDVMSVAWTNGGTPTTGRTLLEFDLSAIPAGAIINSAELSLYGYTSVSNGSHSSLSGSNESYIQRVTTSWNENTVTWNTQPSVTTAGQAVLAQSTFSPQDYLNIDVTAMVQAMMTSGNNGFMLRLATESYYRRMIFGSSDNSNSALHPKLVINYTPNNTPCLALRPGADGKDALLDSRLNTTNFGSTADMASIAWTNSGTPVTGRSLVQFDMTGIPLGSSIVSADLSLYGYTSPGNGSHSSLSGSNESRIERVTSIWAENTVTWSTQPSTDNTTAVTLAQSTVTNQNYVVDVKDIVEDQLSMGNNGFMLKLVNESYYRRMIFASGDNSDSALHPMLTVCYNSPLLGIAMSAEKEPGMSLNIYPNPATGMVTVVSDPSESDVQIELVNSSGQVVRTISRASAQQEIDLSGFTGGFYLVRVTQGGLARTGKLIIQ